MFRPLRVLLGRRRSLRDWAVGAMAVAAFGLAAWAFAREDGRRSYRLTITGCSRFDLRHQIALMLAREAVAHDLDLEVVPTEGSEDALVRVDAGALDLALVQGGLRPGNLHGVRQVAALLVEPLHLLVKREIFQADGGPDIDAVSPDEVSGKLEYLEGRTINIGPTSGGTHWLALEALRFVGLRPGTGEAKGEFRASTLGLDQLERIADRDALPDAVFLVSTPPSQVAKHLVTAQDYRLVPLPFAEAFALDAFNTIGTTSEVPGILVDKMHIQDAVIPAFTYQVEPVPVPPEPIHTLGTRMLLVAREGLDPGAVAGLLETIFEGQFARVAKPSLAPGMLEMPPELPLHAGTRAYLRRSKPLIAGDLLDVLDKLVTLGAPLAGGLLFVWQWYRVRSRRHRDEGFEHYIGRVTEVERRALRLELDARLGLRELLQLQHELGQLKADALARFVAGQIAGEDLMSGFLAQVNDARNYLARLILHERDNLEAEAREQGRPVKALWNEAIAGLAADDAGADPIDGAGPGTAHQNAQAPAQST